MDNGIDRGTAFLDSIIVEQQNETLPETITRLAALHPLEYEQIRENEAKRLNVRVGILDKEVSVCRRASLDGGDKSSLFPTVEPWPEPVDAQVLLDDILAMIQRHIVCKPETAHAATLWIAFTWIIDHVGVAPLAVITAPEKRCGKSQLLDLIGRLSLRPLVASNISPAAVFRVIEAHRPTLLIDEADTFLKESEELRGLLNSGHTRQNAYAIRVVGDDHKTQQFSTWGAKAISGIGILPETLMDRAIVLELRRKLSHETVQRLRHTDPRTFSRLASRLARFAEDAGAEIACIRPPLPEQLNDRAQDNWEPLLAIADYAGGDWPSIARESALHISSAEQEAVSLSAELLADIREVFEYKQADRLSTADLLKELCSDDLKPWATYNRGQPIRPRQIANKLKEFGIKSETIRTAAGTPRGYLRERFEDAFIRYVAPPTPPEAVRNMQQSEDYSYETERYTVSDKSVLRM